MTQPKRPKKGNNRGAILVFTLWVLAFVGVLAVGLTTRARMSIFQAGWLERTSTANIAMDSLVALAVQRHAEAIGHTSVDYGEPWARKLEQVAIEAPEGPDSTSLSSRRYNIRMSAVDESGKLNINFFLAYVHGSGNKELLEQVLLLAGGGPESALTADGMLDWWDPDGEGLAEERAYTAAGKPYGPPNADIKQIDELRFILGVTPLLFYGEDANHNGVLDPEENDGPEAPPEDNQNGQLELGLRAYLTVEGGPELNLNTMPGPLLQVVFGDILGDDGDQAARTFLARRDGADKIAATADDAPLRAPEELAAILDPGLVLRIASSGIGFDVISSAYTHYFEVEFPAVPCLFRSEIVVKEEEGKVAVASYQEY